MDDTPTKSLRRSQKMPDSADGPDWSPPPRRRHSECGPRIILCTDRPDEVIGGPQICAGTGQEL